MQDEAGSAGKDHRPPRRGRNRLSPPDAAGDGVAASESAAAAGPHRASVRFVGASAKWRGRSAATAAAAVVRAGALGLDRVAPAVVLPRAADDGAGGRYAGAVVDGAGVISPLSLRLADGVPLGPAEGDLAAATKPRRLSGTALFLGPLFDAFGHFLVETTARLWALDTAEGRAADHVVFAFRPGPVPAFARVALDALALGHRLVLADRPLRFDAVLVPEAAYALGGGVHPAFKAGCERLGALLAAGADGAGPPSAGGLPPAGVPVYLTRARLDPWATTSAVVGERQIEAALTAAGVAVVAPETMALAAQAALARAAPRLAGVDGSALHLALFAEDPLDLAIVCRRPLPRPFPAIDAVRRGASAYLDALAPPDDPRLVPNRIRARGFPKLLDVPKALAFLAAEGFGYPPTAGDGAALAEAAVGEHNALAVAALCREAVRRSRPEAAAEVEAVRRQYHVAEEPALERLIAEMHAALGGAATGRGAWKAVRQGARRDGLAARWRGLVARLWPRP